MLSQIKSHISDNSFSQSPNNVLKYILLLLMMRLAKIRAKIQNYQLLLIQHNDIRTCQSCNICYHISDDHLCSGLTFMATICPIDTISDIVLKFIISQLVIEQTKLRHLLLDYEIMLCSWCNYDWCRDCRFLYPETIFTDGTCALYYQGRICNNKYCTNCKKSNTKLFPHLGECLICCECINTYNGHIYNFLSH